MSLKDRFANHSENAAEQPQPEEQKSVELYDTAGHARNICFVQVDGSMTFLNYAYLISGSYDPKKNLLVLYFTTHKVTISGETLTEVFDWINSYRAKKITAIEKRYALTLSAMVITSIKLEMIDK